MTWQGARDVLNFLAGPFLGLLIVAWATIRRKKTIAQTLDSGLEYITKRERLHIEKVEKRQDQIEADNREKELRIDDLHKQVRKRDEIIIKLQHEHERLSHAHAKTVIDVAAALPAMSVEEREHFKNTTGFGEPDF